MTQTGSSNGSGYHRYHIHTERAPELEQWPPRFDVKVRRTGLAKLLLTEMIHYGPKNKDVILSRPCLYGVFSGPVGGFIPRPQNCVGCLRCTTEFPDFVRVSHNPERRKLGDEYFTFGVLDAVSYEAEGGLIPVKGAGYRGKFGGEGWDGMWTDMSEIVRPTRDGIHGREFISTVVDIGSRPGFLRFDTEGKPEGETPRTLQIPLPILFDAPPPSAASNMMHTILAHSAEEIENLAFLPVVAVLKNELSGPHVVPVIKPGQQAQLARLRRIVRLIALDGWDADTWAALKAAYPDAILILRTAFAPAEELLGYYQQGVRVFHLLADYHGRGWEGQFVLDLIRKAHKAFVDAGVRQEVTLIGSGGIIHAEHVPKAILCGLDAVAIDTTILVALQARFEGECRERATSAFRMPAGLSQGWGVQRLKNLTACWRDQLLEIMGAMGLREVRRLRGEMGRAMFMKDLERDAFAGVQGYDPRA